MADDLSVIYTDKKLQTLERKLKQTYKQAQKDIEKKTAIFFEKTAKKDAVMQGKLSAGKITQEEYDHWRRGKMLYGENWKAQQESIAKVLADTNKVATAMINAEKADVFAFAGNYTAYEFEHGFGVNFGFDLYDEKSVERLLRDNPKILPKKKLDPAKDIPWNMRNVRAQVTQGIIQGESIPKIAKRLAEVVPNRNEHQMVLHARTAMTGAQNGGRMERYKEAEDLGIKFKKVWTATLDNRTRDEHRDLDGQAVNPDEPFKIHGEKIMFPGDPEADPSLVYNCRCTLTTELDDYPANFARRAYDEYYDEDGNFHRDSYITEGTTYREWEQKKKESETSTPDKNKNDNTVQMNTKTLDSQIKTEAMNEFDYWSKEQEEFRREKIKEYTGFSDEKVESVLYAFSGNGQEYAEYANSGAEYKNCWFYGQDTDIRMLANEDAIKKANDINDYILAAPKYSGKIYRGMALDESQLSELQTGSVFHENGSLSSWTSEFSVAGMFADGRSEELQKIPVILETINAKYSSPVSHLSVFGIEESEVLVTNMQMPDYVVRQKTLEGGVYHIVLELMGG